MLDLKKANLVSIGLVNARSVGGIAAALMVSDGEQGVREGEALMLPYGDAVRERLMAVEQGDSDDARKHLADDIADIQAKAVTMLLDQAGLSSAQIDLIGCHGHAFGPRNSTGQRSYVQICDAQRLADRLELPIISCLCRNDIENGGRGMPLTPTYHFARLSAQAISQRVALLDLGEVASLTLCDPPAGIEGMMAFDVGPAEALIEDWAAATTLAGMDRDGRLAASGNVHDDIVLSLLDHPFFTFPPPKFLDAGDFSAQSFRGLSLEDGAATIMAFTVEAIAAGREFLPAIPDVWYVSGSGRHNPVLMARLEDRLGVTVDPVEVLGWRGDFLAAEAVAYLAVRSVKGLTLSWPRTTGVRHPVSGGELYAPSGMTIDPQDR